MAGIRPILILLTGIGIGMLAPQLSLNEVKPVWTPATECYCPQTPNESTAAVEKLEKPEEVKERYTKKDDKSVCFLRCPPAWTGLTDPKSYRRSWYVYIVTFTLVCDPTTSQASA